MSSNTNSDSIIETIDEHGHHVKFELIDITKRGAADMTLRTKIYTARDYPNYGDLNSSAVLLEHNQPKITFGRLLIRRKR